MFGVVFDSERRPSNRIDLYIIKSMEKVTLNQFTMDLTLLPNNEI